MTATQKARAKCPRPRCREAEYVLKKIAEWGAGLKDADLDWPLLGQEARRMARDYFVPKCPKCGK